MPMKKKKKKKNKQMQNNQVTPKQAYPVNIILCLAAIGKLNVINFTKSQIITLCKKPE